MLLRGLDIACCYREGEISMKERVRVFNMPKLVLLMCVFIFVGFWSPLIAQIKITGKIVHKDKSPIEFAEVVLLNKDSMGILSSLANEDGTFLLTTAQGLYTLQIRQFSAIFYTKSITAAADLNLGTIEIENSSQELTTIDVEVKDKLIERKIDRVVFNVENSLRALGGDALGALSVTPGVRVQNNKLSMIGKSSLAVMVDDKLIQLSGEDLANYLKAIPADLIKSIEVISIPPSKYDADGNSGYVNIILKKGRKNAWNTSLNADYFQRMYGDGSGSGNFNYNKNKLSLTASAFYRKVKFNMSQKDDIFFPDGKRSTSNPFTLDQDILVGRVGFDYQLSPKWIIGSQLMNSTGRSELDGTTYTFVQDDATEKRKFYQQAINSETNSPVSNTINLYNEFSLDSTGRKITVNLDYLSFSNADKKGYDGNSVNETPFSYKYFQGLNINQRSLTNFSGKVDVELPLKWINLSGGGKASTSASQNNITFYNSGIVDAPITGYLLDKNKFEYIENVGALYLSGSKKINKHWESQVGIRGEFTDTKTYVENLDFNRKSKYLKFFPSAYLTYTINDNSALSLRYSKRIDRPNFEDLNPNMYFLTPFQTVQGNAFLQPSFIDNLEFVHAFKNLESKVYVSSEKNVIAQIPINNPLTGTTLYTNENFINSKKIGIAENFIVDKLDWWTSVNALDVNYAATTSNIAYATPLTGFSASASTDNDFVLNKKKTILFNASYRYDFPSIFGILRGFSQSSCSLALQFLLLDKKLKISLSGADIFRKEVDATTSLVNGIKQYARNYSDRQYFGISVSYKFGNKTISVAERETGNEEEKNRAQ